MNANRQLTRQEISQRVKNRRLAPAPTIQADTLEAPLVELHEFELKPEQGKSRKAQRAAAKTANIIAAVEQEAESPMTLSGLTENQRRREKRWLKREGLRLRSKQEQQHSNTTTSSS
jgi:hypothetical protein